MLEEFIALSNDIPDFNICFDECYFPESFPANDEIDDQHLY